MKEAHGRHDDQIKVDRIPHFMALEYQSKSRFGDGFLNYRNPCACDMLSRTVTVSSGVGAVSECQTCACGARKS